MTNPQDFTKAINDMMGNFPTDFTAFEDVIRSSAKLGEKFSKVALTAAEQSADISNKWTRDTLGKLGVVSQVRKDPADYSKVATDFASATAEAAAENLAAYAEVAKRLQMETVDLLLASGKEASQEATAAMKKATADVTATAKKAAKAA